MREPRYQSRTVAKIQGVPTRFAVLSLKGHLDLYQSTTESLVHIFLTTLKTEIPKQA